MSTSKSFALWTSVTASTKRNPAIASGKRGAAVTNISSLKCTQLDPVNPEIAERLGLGTPHEALETFVDTDLDIIEGDFLIVGTKTYPIRSVAEWTWRGAEYLHLIIEELKT